MKGTHSTEHSQRLVGGAVMVGGSARKGDGRLVVAVAVVAVAMGMIVAALGV